MTAEARPQPSSLFRECTLQAIVLTPERPIANWLVQLDRSVQQSREFLSRARFSSRSVGAPTEAGGAQGAPSKAAQAQHPDHGGRGHRPGLAWARDAAPGECRLAD